MKESKRKLWFRGQTKLIIKEKYRKQMGKQPLNNKLINKSQFDNDNSLYVHTQHVQQVETLSEVLFNLSAILGEVYIMVKV